MEYTAEMRKAVLDVIKLERRIAWIGAMVTAALFGWLLGAWVNS